MITVTRVKNVHRSSDCNSKKPVVTQRPTTRRLGKGTTVQSRDRLLQEAMIDSLKLHTATQMSFKSNYNHIHGTVLFIWSPAAAAKSLQSCPPLCDPIGGSPPGSPVPGTLQARTLEWVPISFSSAWKWKVKVKLLSRVRLFATPWTAAYQVPPSMGFSRQEYWSGVPSPSPLYEAQKNTKLYSIYSETHSYIIK